MKEAYSAETLEDYLEEARSEDKSYISCCVFDDTKEALTWLNS